MIPQQPSPPLATTDNSDKNHWNFPLKAAAPLLNLSEAGLIRLCQGLKLPKRFFFPEYQPVRDWQFAEKELRFLMAVQRRLTQGHSIESIRQEILARSQQFKPHQKQSPLVIDVSTGHLASNLSHLETKATSAKTLSPEQRMFQRLASATATSVEIPAKAPSIKLPKAPLNQTPLSENTTPTTLPGEKEFENYVARHKVTVSQPVLSKLAEQLRLPSHHRLPRSKQAASNSNNLFPYSLTHLFPKNHDPRIHLDRSPFDEKRRTNINRSSHNHLSLQGQGLNNPPPYSSV